jgi:hypothetical protein
MKAVWVVGIILLFGAVLLMTNPSFPGYTTRPRARPIHRVITYRPTETMGSNAVSFPGLDTKALCATTDIC